MIEIVNNLLALSKLEPGWNQLGARFDSPMLQFDWFYSCAENLHKESELHVIVYRSDNEIKAIAPLVTRKNSISTWLELLGSSALYEPSGLLFDSPQSLDNLLVAMVEQGYPINLSRVSKDSPILNASQSLSKTSTICLTRPSAGSFFITTDDDWDTFYSKIGKKWRSDFRNKHSRAASQGTVGVEIYCPSVDQFSDTMNKVMDIEQLSWKGRQGTCLHNTPHLKNFFLNYARRCMAQGILRTCFYNISDESIAMNLGVEFGNRLWFFKTGYNEEWSRVSPGMQLNMASIKYTFDKRLAGYEFLGSEESWQNAWPVKSHDYCSVILLPFSTKGILGLGDIVLKFAKNRLSKS